MKTFTFLILIHLAFINTNARAETYHPQLAKCDGYPLLPLVTIEGTCVGLIAQKDKNIPLRKPRSLIEINERQLLVVDAGAWVANQGKLILLDYSNAQVKATILLEKLNMPHKILSGPDNYYYLGEADKIKRFQFSNNTVTKMETVIDQLPFNNQYLHPLKNFIFDANNNLIINIGSSSDRCEKQKNQSSCINGEQAGLRLYPYNKDSHTFSSQYSIIATGLRNSMALVIHSSGTLLQAENSIDLDDPDEPYEELNIIENNRFYGWPDCYNNTASLTTKTCQQKNYQAPWTLLPPHIAPLDMIFYRSDKISVLKNKLIMSWHGFRIAGNRLVAYSIDEKGRPLLQEKASFRRAPLEINQQYTEHNFAPKGGFLSQENAVAQHIEIISEWNEIQGLRPEGSPVGLTQARDGSLFIVDDRNAAILRLSTGESYQPTKANNPTDYSTVNLPDDIHKILLNRCSQCHNQLIKTPQHLLNDQHWLKLENQQKLMETKLFFDTNKPMPPNKNLTQDEKIALHNWLANITQLKP